MTKRQAPDDDLQRLFSALTTAVIVADAKLRITLVNPAAESLLALSATKLIGRTLLQAFVGPSDFIGLIERAVNDDRSFTKRDLELTATSLHRAIVDCTVSPWSSHEGDEVQVILEFASIERHQRIQLEENMVLQNQVTTALMRGIAHEVRNPLGGIRGAAQLLERELDNQRLAEYTQIIIGEADRLRNLVDTMLGPNRTLDCQALNIHDVLERVRVLVETEHSRRLEIGRDYDPSLPEIQGDRDQLIQAFLNLVRNAVRAVDDTDGRISLRTRAQRKFTIGEKMHRVVMRVDVIDNGPGVAAEIADTIFFPMVTGHADGTGLGLPLAQAILNRQGGLIGFQSEPGNTIFSAWLPIEVGP